jgi:hypothetical protein
MGFSGVVALAIVLEVLLPLCGRDVGADGRTR